MLKIDVSADALASSQNSALAAISPKVEAVAEALSNSPAIFEAIGGRLRLYAIPFVSVMSDDPRPDFLDRSVIPISPSQGSLNYKGSKIPFVAFGLRKSSGEEALAILHQPDSQKDWQLCLNNEGSHEFEDVAEAFNADKIALIRDIFAGKGFTKGRTNYSLIDSNAVKKWYNR